MIKALLWKEWHQLRWKLVFSLVIVAAFMTLSLRTRIIPDEGIFAICILGISILMPVFVMMGLFAEEAEEGSLTLQVRLPVKARKVYAVKMSAGLITAACPLILSVLLAMILAGGREVGIPHIMRMYGPAFLYIVVFVIWIAAWAIAADSEFKVVLAAIAIFFAWALFGILDDSFGWGRISMVLTPLGFFEAGFDKSGGPAVILVQCAAGAVLFVWGMIRFEKLGGRGK